MTKNPVFGRDALKELDRRAVEEFHLLILVLMENAGRAVAEAARRMAKVGTTHGVLVLVGTGNNGGDGLVAARHLHNAGLKVEVLLLSPREKYENAAGAQLKIVEAMGLHVDVLTEGHNEFRDWLVEAGADDLIIDAIFGTGLSRPVEGLAAEVIRAANTSQHRILSVDIPSGMDADTGKELGASIKAAETVSFCGLKRGFLQPRAKALTGHVTVGGIGAPRQLLEQLADR